MSVLNGERFLAEAIESVLDQSFSDFEFIVIDDGSEDASAAILNSYQMRDSRLRVYGHKHRGLAESLNRGCGIAQGKYVARMDADDIATPNRLQWQVRFMEAHPDVGLLGGVIDFIDENGREFRRVSHPIEDAAIRRALNHDEASFCHPATMMRKDVLVSVGGYRTSFLAAEDYDLWLRMASCSRLANLDGVVLKYRIHKGQVSQRQLVQQALSCLAARTCLSEGQDWEELRQGQVVTAEVLTRHGVSEAKQEHVLMSRYRDSIYILSLQGDIPDALDLSESMFRSSRWEHVERSLKAHLWLLTASLYWGRGQLKKSLQAVGRALVTWPIVAVRPLKALLVWMSKAVQTNILRRGLA